MELTTIKQDGHINFADCVPSVKEIMLEAIEVIMDYEGATAGNAEDYAVHHSSNETNNTFGGAFIFSKYGSYILHDIREEQIQYYENDDNLYTVIFYSITKIEDK